MERTLHLAGASCQLIVNADDLGVSAERDAGILDLYARGSVTSASLLVNGSNAAAAAARAVAAGLPLGLHLNLSEGRAATAGSLAGADGLLRGKFGTRAALAAGTIAGDDLARAIRAQFDAFIALTGELPSHVDGHHHIHVEPAVAAVLAPIMAREYGVCCVRLPRQRGLAGLAADADFNPDFQLAVAHAASAAEALFAAHGIYSTDAFLGQSFMGYRLRPEAVAAALQQLADEYRPTPSRPLSVELMVHPGVPATGADGSDFCRSPARGHELTMLRSRAWRAAITGWKTTSFAALPRPTSAERPTVLLYGKLTPGTGNAETARRYEAAWAVSAEVRFRPLVADPASPLALARERRRLQALAARERIDLAFGIHLYRAGVPLAAAFAADEQVPLPFGLLTSGTDVNADLGDPVRQAAMAAAVGQADFLLCLTGEQQTRLAGLALPQDTTVLPSGIDIATDSHYSLRRTLALADDARLILFPAAQRRLKGILPAIESLAAALATRFPSHVLVVLGPQLEPDYARELEQRIAELCAAAPALSGRLLLRDGLPRADYLAALREADLVLNASAHEGLSHAIGEAMAAGVPVLARDNAGNRQLIRDGENGRLFTDFADLPAAYAECFTAADTTARLAAQAARDIAVACPAATEREMLQALLARTLARRQAPLPFTGGPALRLDLAPGTHPLSPENVELFRRIEASPALPATLALAIDVGCGCGAFGLALLDVLAGQQRRVRRMFFSDPHQPSLDALSRTLTRHALRLSAAADEATLDDGPLLAPLLTRGERADVICANLPQTPGPAGFRSDRYGGSDGADLLCALIAQLPAALAEGGEAFLVHIDLAHPARVAAMLAQHGLQATVLATQQRSAALADYDALQPGLANYLLAERAAGRARFTPAGGMLSFAVRLLRVRRTPAEPPPSGRTT